MLHNKNIILIIFYFRFKRETKTLEYSNNTHCQTQTYTLVHTQEHIFTGADTQNYSHISTNKLLLRTHFISTYINCYMYYYVFDT